VSKIRVDKRALLPQIVEKSLNSPKCLLTRGQDSCKKAEVF
jgi:hypothetical protein